MPSDTTSAMEDALDQRPRETTSNTDKEFYVECEVILSGEEDNFMLQQTISTDDCYNFDACYNSYCNNALTPTNDSTASKHTEHIATSENGIHSASGSSSVTSDPTQLDKLIPLDLTSSYTNEAQSNSSATHFCSFFSDDNNLQVLGDNTQTATRVDSQSNVLHASNHNRMHKPPEGIASYILNEEDTQSDHQRYEQSTKRKHNPASKRKPKQPWYCVTRPISEQTRDIKISKANKSSSINLSRLLQQCRSIVEFCMADAPLEDKQVAEMNYNHSWGDPLPSGVKGNTIRVVYQNVNRSVSASDNPFTSNLLDKLNDMEADVFMASETNVNWKSATFRNEFKRKVSNIWPANRMAFSTSDIGLEFELHEYLPGGTCTMAVDNLSMRVIKVGEDESGLGR